MLGEFPELFFFLDASLGNLAKRIFISVFLDKKIEDLFNTDNNCEWFEGLNNPYSKFFANRAIEDNDELGENVSDEVIESMIEDLSSCLLRDTL